MTKALWVQGVVLLLGVPVFLLVPEVPLGRVVALDLRWLCAAALGGMGTLSVWMAKDLAVRRAGAASLAVAAALTGCGATVQGGGRGMVVGLVALASLALSARVWRSASSP